VKELFQKLGFVSNQEGKKEVKKNTDPQTKGIIENSCSEKLNGIVFNCEKKEDTLKGCFFSKEE
jgi:hypothetical protein